MANLQRLLRIGLALTFNPVAIVEDAAAAARRVAILSVCAIVAGFILLPAAGCGAAALWIFVQHRLGAVWAALITAAALLLLALIVLGIGIAQSKRPARGRDERPSRRAAPAVAWPAAASAILASIPPPQELGAAGRGFFRRHKGTALLAAVVAGLIFGQDVIRPRRPRKGRPGS
jgi:hypothetical protein